ncbi:hypothetical protein PENSUB_8640 [Penicillium subrubescens]|uniref:Uncharacterized protein n=1 Tax=Penicillium subrubescens TaxID=1316194 RepID=A0A1Q5TGA0_9EURO|nr:hypothetical protein PENSUB_8640 [Penicillium subrubescens]
MENDRKNNKESEEEYLDEEAPENHILAHVHTVLSLRAGKANLQTPPIVNGIMNQLRARTICTIWITVVSPKRAATGMAAPPEGL